MTDETTSAEDSGADAGGTRRRGSLNAGSGVALGAGIGAVLALSAARLSVESRLPMADSVILATAREYDATLWTQDSDFEGMEKVQFRRWRS